MHYTLSSPVQYLNSNNYSPYWQARIDNQEEQLFLVDQTFQGVFIPQGNHEVILEYKPPYSLF